MSTSDFKVFAATIGHNGDALRIIIAARSRKEAGEYLGLGRLAQNVLLNETHNGNEVITALKEPGTAFARPVASANADFIEWEQRP